MLAYGRPSVADVVRSGDRTTTVVGAVRRPHHNMGDHTTTWVEVPLGKRHLPGSRKSGCSGPEERQHSDYGEQRNTLLDSPRVCVLPREVARIDFNLK